MKYTKILVGMLLVFGPTCAIMLGALGIRALAIMAGSLALFGLATIGGYLIASGLHDR